MLFSFFFPLLLLCHTLFGALRFFRVYRIAGAVGGTAGCMCLCTRLWAVGCSGAAGLLQSWTVPFFYLDYNFYICSISAFCCLCIDAIACTFFFLQTSSQVTQYNSNAKMSCLLWGVKKLVAIALAYRRLENIPLFCYLCLCHRQPDFNESFEREDISSKAICNVWCLYRCVILMCTELELMQLLVDVISANPMVIIFFSSMKCFCQQGFSFFVCVYYVFFRHFRFFFFQTNCTYFWSQMFSNALASRITWKSCIVALSEGLFFESCHFNAVCVRYLQEKKPFEGFFSSLSIQHRNSKQSLP